MTTNTNDSTPREVLDGPEGSTSYWTTVNASEALPGVITPLNWAWYYEPSEVSLFGIFKSYGVIPAKMAIPFGHADQRFTSVFLGRYVINVDTFRRMADRTPGTSGDANERQFFGSSRPNVPAHRSRRRYGIVAFKLPWSIWASRGKMLRVRRHAGPWWSARIQELESASPERARQILAEAHANFATAQAIHILCSSITQMIYQAIGQLARRAGLAGLETTLVTGFGLEETVVQEELWAVSRGEGGSVEQILREHGFTGPGELARPSWREDPTTARELVERFRALPDDKRPSAVAARQRREREAAERRLFVATPLWRRPLARLLLAGVRAYMPLRESGRAALLHSLDVGRAAAQVIGRHLFVRQVIADIGDIFFLDFNEIDRALGAPRFTEARDIVRRRRSRRAYYESIELPQAWAGRPVLNEAAVPADGGPPMIQGIAVTPGSVTGVARVVSDPRSADDFETGEILVCPLTDPSWASLFVVAAGVVIDVGGPLSHGAIVAREMGIPCVIGTKNGTRVIRSGSTIRIDGSTGTVTLLKHCQSN